MEDKGEQRTQRPAVQSRNSRFVSILGLLALLFFAVLAIYFQAAAIGAFLLLFFLLCLCSRVWSRGICRHVQLSLRAVDGACHVGERCVVELKIRNQSLFPLIWLDVVLPTGSKMLVKPVDAEDYFWFVMKGKEKEETAVRERFVWLLWQQEIIWQEELVAVRRGVIPIEAIGLQAGDGFGMSAWTDIQALDVPVRLSLYPRLMPVSVKHFLKISQEAVASSRGQMEDITLLRSSRPYEPGDPVRKINWRLLAGSGRMTVNVYESVMPACEAFVLDLGSFRYARECTDGNNQTTVKMSLMEPELEGMISLTASCLAALAEHSVPTALVLPGYGTRQAVFCVPEDGRDQLAERMEALAAVDYQAEDMIFPYEEFWQAAHRLGDIYVCTAVDGGSGLDELSDTLGAGRVHLLAGEHRKEGQWAENCLYGSDICGEYESFLREGRRKHAASAAT